MEDELEELRKRKLMEYQAQLREQQRQAALKREYELQKRAAIRQILTPEARTRLANIRAVKPEFAEQIEIQLIQLAQSGRLMSKITDSQLKEILAKIQERKREFKIRRA